MKNSLLRKIVVPMAFFLGGLAASLVMLEISLRVIAYVYVHNTAAKIPAVSKDHSRTVVACFGDSFTEGGHSPFKDRYPAQLQRMFDAAGEKVEAINYGVCESNSTQVYRRLKRIAEMRRLDYVVLLVGSTNRYNFIGFNDSPLMYYIKGLRVCRLAHVFQIYVRDRLLRLRARHSARSPEFVFDKVAMESPQQTYEDVRQMVRKEPANEHMLWANYYISQARFSDAMAVLRQAMADGNHDPNILIAMGKCLEGMSDYPAAERMYRASIEHCPEQGYVALGKYYACQGKYDMAERVLRIATEYNAKEGYIELGLLYRDQKKYAQAQEAFKRAHAYDPARADINLINLYAESGRYTEAEAKYEEALVRYPNAFLTDFAVTCYAPRGKYGDAMRCLLKALDQQSPPDMFPFFLMTSIFTLQSDYNAKDVLAVMDRAVVRNPFLANEQTFQAYKEYFRDIDGWEQKRRKWLASDLENIAVLCRQKGITLIIINYPMSFSAANDLLFSVAARHNLSFIDLHSQFSALVARYGKAKYFQTDELHCTSEGNRVMADSVFRKIQSLRTASRKGS